MDREFTREVLNSDKHRKLEMIRTLECNLNFVRLHLNDLENIKSNKYVKGETYYLNNTQVKMINYLIFKYNSMSSGVNIESIAAHLESNSEYIKTNLQLLVIIGLIKISENTHLGTLYQIDKNNLQYCK